MPPHTDVCYYPSDPFILGGPELAPEISVVIVSVNEGVNLANTVDNYRATLPAGSEIIVIDDGSEDGSADSLPAGVRVFRCDRIGVPRARNFGARQSHGQFIFFSDAHIAMQPGGWEPLVEVLRQQRVGGAAPAIADMEYPENTGYGIRFRGPDLIMEWLEQAGDAPYPVQMIPWCCGGMRRDVFEATGGFDEQMIRWGMVDNEMSMRQWLLGYELWVVPRVRAAHLFKEKFPFRMEADWFLHNTLRLALLHFDTARVKRVVAGMRDDPEFPSALALIAKSDVLQRRAELATHRVRDSQWLFQRFALDW